MKKVIIASSIFVIILGLIGIFIFSNKDEKVVNLTNIENIENNTTEDIIRDNVKTFWISTMQGDEVEDDRNPKDVCLNLQKDQGFEDCELSESKKSSNNKEECANGESEAGCFACKISCSSDKGRHSMKGWEIYSWQEDDGMCFSLLVGTNALKSCYIVKSGCLSLYDLKNELNKLAENEFVYFAGKGGVSDECDLLDKLPEEISF